MTQEATAPPHIRPPVSPSFWLLLALTIEQPCSGSELIARYRQRFELLVPRSRGDLSGIRRLEDLGFIEGLLPGSPSSPQSESDTGIHFTATPLGIAAHRQWLSSPIDEQHWRTELLARIATGAVLGVEGLLELVELYHHHAATEASRAERRSASDLDAEGPSKPQSLSALAADLALQEQQDILTIQRDWAERALHAIHEHVRRTHAHGG